MERKRFGISPIKKVFDLGCRCISAIEDGKMENGKTRPPQLSAQRVLRRSDAWERGSSKAAHLLHFSSSFYDLKIFWTVAKRPAHYCILLQALKNQLGKILHCSFGRKKWQFKRPLNFHINCFPRDAVPQSRST